MAADESDREHVMGSILEVKRGVECLQDSMDALLNMGNELSAKAVFVPDRRSPHIYIDPEKLFGGHISRVAEALERIADTLDGLSARFDPHARLAR